MRHAAVRSLMLVLGAMLSAQASPPPGQLDVQVWDGLGAALPLCEVRVSLRERVLAVAKTDGSGLALLSKLPLGLLTVQAEAPGLVVAVQRIELLASQPRRRLLLQLVQAGELRGRVACAGKPVVGARVLVVPRWGEVVQTSTDVDGGYRVQTGLGDRDVLVLSPGHDLGRAQVRIPAATQHDFELLPATSRTLVVRVAGATPEQLAASHCRARFEVADLGNQLPSELFAGALDAAGEWTLRGLPPQLQFRDCDVELPGADVQRDVQRDGELRRDGDVTVCACTVRRRESVRGTLLDLEGKPVVGVPVWCRPDAGGEYLGLTDELGRFETGPAMAVGEFGFLQSGAPGVALPRLSQEGLGIRWPFQFDPAVPIELRTSPAGSIRGVVLSRRGDPVRFAAVVLRDPVRGESIAMTCAGADGRFVIGSLPPSLAGNAVLQVWDVEGIAVSEALQLPVPAGFEVPPLRLHAGGAIVGRAADADGKPAAGAVVFLRPGHHTCVADRQGRFRLALLEAGKYEVRAAWRVEDVRNRAAMAVCEVDGDGVREVAVQVER